MEKTEQIATNAKHVIEVVGGIIRRGGKYLLGKRPEGKSQGGQWEFIGGKIEPGETPEQALARECREEIALDIVNERIRTAVTHAYSDHTIHLTLIDCEPAAGAEPTALEHSELGWFTPEEMSTLDFCPADAESLPVIFPKRKPLIYVCRKDERALDSYTADGLVVFGSGYGDPDQLDWNPLFNGVKKDEKGFYDCGEHAPYRYACYTCDFDVPWIPIEELLVRGARSIVIEFTNEKLMPGRRDEILHLLCEQGYLLPCQKEGNV